jgi:F-type H+-transporting ATPase subunit gamma
LPASPQSVQDTLLQIDGWHETAGVGQVTLFYSRQLPGMACQPHSAGAFAGGSGGHRHRGENQMAGPRPAGLHHGLGLPCFRRSIRHYLFVSLFRAFAETMASENASRLAAMQGAEKNIDERLVELNAQFHQQRQMSITEELLDIVAGFEALST